MSSQQEQIDWSNGPIENGDEAGIIMMPYSEKTAVKSAFKNLKHKVDPEPTTDTPDPTTDDDVNRDGGIIRRTNEFHSTLGQQALESIGLHGPDISKAINKRQDLIFQNQFPLLKQKFAVKCTACGTEHDEEVDICDECGAEDLRTPSQQEKKAAEHFFEQVNKEGQSLRELYKYLEGDHGRLGVAIHLVKKEYAISTSDIDLRGSTIVERGQVVHESIEELVRADPKRLKPVVDENGRLGGFWWTCPCRDRQANLSNEPGECEHCGAELREVFFAETEHPNSLEPENFYFKDEVISWSFFNSRLNGLDGLSPVQHLWLKQAILQWMDLYAAGFYDQEGERYPGKIMIVHTTNAEAFEKQLDKAKDDSQDDPYKKGILYNEYGVESKSAPEAQVIDMMSDEIIGQSDSLKKDYKSDIRTHYGVLDAFDSELEDSGGLNAEGLQIEITDRDIGAAQQDLMEGPLSRLLDILDVDDWRIKFVEPQREEQDLDMREKAETIRTLKEAGADFEITDDGDIELLGAGSDPPAPRPGASQPAVNGGEEGNKNADDSSELEALQQMEEGFKHIVWQDTDSGIEGLNQKAIESFWSEDEDMPDFIKGTVKSALDSAVSPEFDEIDDAQAVRNFFEEKLTQPQGWSLASLSNDLSERFGVAKGYAVRVIQDQVTNILNKAREIGYDRVEPNTGEFHWVGPDDENTTDACKWIKQQAEGGVELEELKDLVVEANEKFFPEHPQREWVPHFGCRHTFTQQIG